MASFAENQQEDVLEAIKALQNVNKDDVQDIVQALEYLSLADCFEEFDVFDSISTFLGMKGRGPEFVALHKQLAKCIAEITKGEKQREYFTHDNVCHCLLSNLARIEEAAAHGSNSELMEVMVQSCRALGNICYMNDEAREIVAKRDGDRILLRLLDFGNDNPAFYKVRCGLLSNYLIDGEEVSQRCLELGLVGKLSSIIAKSVSDKAINEELLVNILPLLSILTENVEPEMNFEDALNRNLAQILARSTSPDLAETCLELLHYESENDDVKTLLAKEGLCQSLFQLMEKNKTQANNEEARAIMKLACDLIVLILTGNDAMNLLHDTDLVANMESWVDEDDIILITTGVLALGNFARTDTHCIELVEKGLATKLLQILAKNNMPDSDVRLQHALLSTLRNLVIPQVNKGAVIEAGLIETMLPMLTSPPPHNYPVVFKLLGALRMTIDKQEQLALRLLQDKRLMEQLVEWGGNSDHMGVSGESLRLLAWLLKNAYLHKFRRNEEAMVVDEEEWDARGVLAFMQVPKAVKMMVSLLGSQHMVMQNEGLVTLLVMETILLRENDAAHIVELESLLVQADLGGMLLKFISTSSEVMTKEIVDNLNTLMKMVRQSPALCEHLARHDVEEQMKLVPVLVEYCTL